MKSTVLTLISVILMSVAAPSASIAEKKSGSGGVIVMSRGEVDPAELETQIYAYVSYKSEGIEGSAWGRIVRIEPDGIVIESEAEPLEIRKISFGDVDILAVAKDRLTFESWLDLRLAAKKITVLTREDLDLTKVATGSYAHVVYTWRGLKWASFGRVLEVAPHGILVLSGTEQTETAKIAAPEIDTLAFANSLQAVERWQKWSERGIVQMSRWDLNPSMLEEGLHVHVVYNSHGRKRKAVGRIIGTYRDRVVIQYRVGGKATWAHPENLEVAYRDVETVIAARDRQDLQTLGRTRTYFGYSNGHKVERRARVAMKLIFGSALGAVTAAPAALSFHPDLYLHNASRLLLVIPAAILHAAATGWVVNKVDPPAQYKHTFAGSLLGCAAVSSAVHLSDLDGYEGPVVAWLGYISVTTLAATIASEISRGLPDEPGFSVGLAPRRNGSVSAFATYRF